MQNEPKDGGTPEPDYGSTPVWSNDDEKRVQQLLKHHNGDIDESIKALFRAGGTEYAEALKISRRFAGCFGITQAEFMTKYRQWRRGSL